MRDHRHDAVGAHLIMAGGRQPAVRVLEAKIDVDVAVEVLELDPVDHAGGDGATAADMESARVVDAREWVTRTAVRRRWGSGLRGDERAACGQRNQREEGEQAHDRSMATRR